MGCGAEGEVKCAIRQSSTAGMDQIQLPPTAVRLLELMARGDATRSEIAALRLPHQSRVLTQLVAGVHGMIDQALIGHQSGFEGQAAVGAAWQLFLVVVRCLLQA